MNDNVVELGTSHGSSKGLAIEWDAVALDGVGRLFKACAEVLGEVVEVTPLRFQTRILGKPLADAIAELAPEADAAALAEKVQEVYLTGLAEAADSPRAEILALAKSVAKRGARIGILSELSPDFLQPVLVSQGLGDALVVSDPAEAAAGFGPKTWHRVPAELELAAQMGVAIVASRFSLRSAMAANLCTIVLPDAMTAFQDFGGSDLFVESYSPAVDAAVAAALRLDA